MYIARRHPQHISEENSNTSVCSIVNLTAPLFISYYPNVAVESESYTFSLPINISCYIRLKAINGGYQGLLPLYNNNNFQIDLNRNNKIKSSCQVLL